MDAMVHINGDHPLQLKPWHILIGILAIGLFVLLASHSILEGSGIWKDLSKDVGIALITAFVLGITIDRTLKLGIARDVLETTLGYILHPDLRRELRWLYEFDLVASTYDHEYELIPDGESVLVRETVSQTIESLSGKEVVLYPSLGAQEWFGAKRTAIVSATCTVGKERYTLTDGDFTLTARFQDQPILSVGLSHPIKVSKLQKATVVYVYEEVRARSDASYSFFDCPALNPTARIKKPDDLDCWVKFANRNRDELKELGGGQFRQEGLLLPGQVIRLRWWQRSDMEKWQNNSSH